MLDSKRFKALVRAYLSSVGKIKNIYYSREGDAVLECRVDSTLTLDDLIAEQKTISDHTEWNVRIFPHYIPRDMPREFYESLCRAVGGLKYIKRISFSKDVSVITHYRPDVVKREYLEAESQRIGKIEVRDVKGRTVYKAFGNESKKSTLSQ